MDNKAGQNKRRVQVSSKKRFHDRGGPDWKGPVVDYKEVELLRKFMTASSKMMSRKRAGTSSSEQRDVRRAIKRARFMALLPFVGI
ncbi:MAG: 30S ribosomal protein S18 [Phycisphaerae bacterium]|nr:30S ribosomal protein S18 [Phycisphaerae bacterium]